MQTVWLFTISNFIFFAPIYLNSYYLVDYKIGKLYFSISLFGITIFGGYCTIKNLKIFVHYSDKKAAVIDICEYVSKNKTSFKLQGVEVYKIITQTRCSYVEFSLINLLQTVNVVNNTIVPIIIQKKDFLKIKNDFVIVNANEFWSCLNVGIFFNLFSLSNALINVLIKKGIRYVRTKK